VAEIGGGVIEQVNVIDEKHTDDYSAYHGDSCIVAHGIPDNSIGFEIFSPPFASLFSYTDASQDLGNSVSDEEFLEHFNFLVPELYRALMPGRLMAVHCMNLPCTIERDGYIGIRDFRGDLIRLFLGQDGYLLSKAREALLVRALFAERDGDVKRSIKLQDAAQVILEDLQAHPGKMQFIYHSEVVIWKDPLLAATRTHALGLAHQQIVKDSARCRQGYPDYLVVMMKPGVNPEPVTHEPRGFERYIGTDPEPQFDKTNDPATNKYSHYVWRKYAEPVWYDINPTDTLQRKSAREDEDQRHVCPLQKGVIQRAIELWTNPRDIVFSPFGGIGSEGYVALEMNRRAVLVELKSSYYDQMVRNLDSVLEKRTQLKLDLEPQSSVDFDRIPLKFHGDGDPVDELFGELA
jgi:hypothetical protein